MKSGVGGGGSSGGGVGGGGGRGDGEDCDVDSSVCKIYKWKCILRNIYFIIVLAL